MATTRPFAYNTGSPIAGTEQLGDLAIGTPTSGFISTGIEWWNGPDEELGYIVCIPVEDESQHTPVRMTWDKNKMGSGIILSNSDATITDGGFKSVLAESRIFTNVMFSIQLDTPGISSYIGISKSDMDLNGYAGDMYGKSIGFNTNGELRFQGNPIHTGLPTWGNIGDVIDIAIDYVYSGLWIRVNGGNWNNNPSADPSVNIGGVTTPLTLINTYPIATLYNGGNPGSTASATLIKDPIYSVPSGFQYMKNYAHVKFIRSSSLTDQSFIDLVNSKFNQNFLTAQVAKDWLNTNGMWTSYGQIPEGMVLYLDAGVSSSYPGTGTTWYDLSGYNNDGKFAGAVSFSPTSGGTMEFDGINSAITFDSTVEIPIGNEPYTISVWFNSDEMPSIRGFVSWGEFGSVNQVNAWRLQNFSGNTGFVHYWWGNDLSFQTPMTSGTWYNAIAAYSNGSRKIYLNNVQVAEDFPTGHNVPYSTNLRIGVTADFFGEWFDGKIAQVVIYKRQATPQEIEAIWNSGKSRFGY